MYGRKEEQKRTPRESGFTEEPEPQVLRGLMDAGILLGIRVLRLTCCLLSRKGVLSHTLVPGLCVVVQAVCSYGHYSKVVRSV